MEEELQKQAEGILGNWVWLFVSGVALLLFKSTIETVVEGMTEKQLDYIEKTLHKFCWPHLNIGERKKFQ